MISNKTILRLIDLPLSVVYRILLLFVSRRVRKRMPPKPNYVSICAIFKNEAPYLREWIEYHRMLGVDHIYFYNNFSDDHYQQVIDPYLEQGYVDLVDWPFKFGQIAAYTDCYEKHREETTWLAFLDLDEFVCPWKETHLADFLRKYEGYPSVCVYWQMFGTSGLFVPDQQKLVIEQYTHAWDGLHNVGKLFMYTAREYRPTRIYHHHLFCRYDVLRFFTIKIPMINEKFRCLFFPQIYSAPQDSTIQLNHYWSRSWAEYVQKIQKGDVFSQRHENERKPIDFFYANEHRNLADNKVIWRFLLQLK